MFFDAAEFKYIKNLHKIRASGCDDNNAHHVRCRQKLAAASHEDSGLEEPDCGRQPRPGRFVRRQKLKGLLQLEGAIDIQDNWREMEEEEIKQIRKERRSRRGSS